MRDWEVKVTSMADSDHVYAMIMIDSEPVGMLRLPNVEYVAFVRNTLREKLGGK